METLPIWYEGTKECIEANLHQLKEGFIDKEKASRQIMAHIKTLIEIQTKK